LLKSEKAALSNISFGKLIKCFEKIIIRFEKKEFQDFLESRKKLTFQHGKKSKKRKKNSFESLKDKSEKHLNIYCQLRIYVYWRARTDILKRPFLRCYWKILHVSFHGFRNLDPNKNPFAPRPRNKKKIRLKNRCVRGSLMLQRLKQLRHELNQSLELVKMVTLREKLKFQSELMTFYPFSQKLEVQSKKREKIIDKVRVVIQKDKLVKMTKNQLKEISKRNENQDQMIFVCNLIESLSSSGLHLNDFKSSNANRTSRYLKKMKNDYFRMKIGNQIPFDKRGNSLISQYQINEQTVSGIYH
jgi:hypothetical protein